MHESQAADAAARRALLRWYRAHRRSLPWRTARRARDPYAIWISEVMLQQTRVATVIPYYARFLGAFPSVRHLANARFERVAEQWSGLGYYRRARQLHEAARKVVADFGGKFPANYQDARTLPGVGHYTASAVLSIAFGKRLAALDGNVARVVARLDGLLGNLHRAKFRRQVEARLASLLPLHAPGEFNQAIMELGETVCLPRRPRCEACPVRRRCFAFGGRDAESYPQPRPRRASELQHLAAAVIASGGSLALVRGLGDGLVADLWNFPSAFGATDEEARRHLHTKLRSLGASRARLKRHLGTVRHRITFRSIRAAVYECSAAVNGAPFRWFAWHEIQTAAVSELARKIASVANDPRRDATTMR